MEMELISFIPEELFILIATIYVLGIFLKRAERISDNLIPVILMVFSIIFSLILNGLGAIAFLQGILCWGVAIGANQTYKQLTKTNNNYQEDLE